MPITLHRRSRLTAVGAIVGAILLSSLLTGCATPPKDPDELAIYKENNDPMEPLNRYFFDLNYGFDELVFKPLAAWYNLLLPTPVEHGVHNVLTNMDAPLVFANDLLQGNGKRAGITAKRFLVNSTLGVAGIFDVASKFGLKYHDTDFGITFAVWGAGEGPYIYLPVLGPTNPRDGAGLAATALADPWSYLFAAYDVQYLSYVRAGLYAVDTRARNLDTLDQIRKGAIDYYATIRSLYRQHRNDMIKHAKEDDPLAALPYESAGGPQLTESN
jgi:phospholipid-binding lipoprotein MlaA